MRRTDVPPQRKPVTPWDAFRQAEKRRELRNRRREYLQLEYLKQMPQMRASETQRQRALPDQTAHTPWYVREDGVKIYCL